MNNTSEKTQNPKVDTVNKIVYVSLQFLLFK